MGVCNVHNLEYFFCFFDLVFIHSDSLDKS